MEAVRYIPQCAGCKYAEWHPGYPATYYEPAEDGYWTCMVTDESIYEFDAPQDGTCTLPEMYENNIVPGYYDGKKAFASLEYNDKYNYFLRVLVVDPETAVGASSKAVPLNYNIIEAVEIARDYDFAVLDVEPKWRTPDLTASEFIELVKGVVPDTTLAYAPGNHDLFRVAFPHGSGGTMYAFIDVDDEIRIVCLNECLVERTITSGDGEFTPVPLTWREMLSANWAREQPDSDSTQPRHLRKALSLLRKHGLLLE